MRKLDEMRQAAQQAMAEGLAKDLRFVAECIRTEAPDRSPEFAAGMAWAARGLENKASQITRS